MYNKCRQGKSRIQCDNCVASTHKLLLHVPVSSSLKQLDALRCDIQLCYAVKRYVCTYKNIIIACRSYACVSKKVTRLCACNSKECSVNWGEVVRKISLLKWKFWELESPYIPSIYFVHFFQVWPPARGSKKFPL